VLGRWARWVDLLVQHSGVGEARLLRPALSATGRRPVAFVQPPHTPDGLGLSYIGLTLEQMLRVKAPKTADALWSVEQILRAGSCGALVFWTQYAQASSLRRLHLAAQSSETLFIMVRPLVAAQDASPALLRLALKPSSEGLTVSTLSNGAARRARSPSRLCFNLLPFCCRGMRAFPASPRLKLPLGVIGKKCLSDLTIVHGGRHMLAPPGLPVIHCARYTRRDVVLP
jgi:hypothetical protein